MLVLYNILSAMALVIYSPVLFLKKGPEDRWAFVSERLGISGCTGADIWVHAVSVGEVLACLPFLKKLKQEFPGHRIVLSTTTYTGQKIARERFPAADRIMYMPWDTGICVNRVVRSLRPRIFITVETELWPVLFNSLKGVGCRVVILNGRISRKSFRGYEKIRFFMKRVLSDVDFLYMQGKGDAERIISIGAEREKVGVMGNFKFDAEFSASSAPAWLEKVGGRILLAASTHKGEEEILLDAYKLVRERIQDARLILAPRHPERFGEAAEVIRKQGLDFIRRSEIRQAPAPGVILLDTMGELSSVFSGASVAFIGGSLVPLGGHNIMEPAYWAKPVIFGPHMDNFPVAREFLKRSAAVQVTNAGDIAETVIELMENPERAQDMGRKARSIIDENRGAVKRAVELVRSFIGTA
ncbi:MAG: 3-deoxy-D-manno-octulosonic acid transferase [Deferribacteres bacterium]|nr:3-deoxy-D-manno-octulosonic acid transferase [Deferribacteres bacterium]